MRCIDLIKFRAYDVLGSTAADGSRLVQIHAFNLFNASSPTMTLVDTSTKKYGIFTFQNINNCLLIVAEVMRKVVELDPWLSYLQPQAATQEGGS